MVEKSSFDHVKSLFIPPEITKHWKTRNSLPITIDRTQLKSRSLKNCIIKTYNWVRSYDLIPQNIVSLSDGKLKKLITQIKENFIINNKDEQQIFFELFDIVQCLTFNYINVTENQQQCSVQKLVLMVKALKNWSARSFIVFHLYVIYLYTNEMNKFFYPFHVILCNSQ